MDSPREPEESRSPIQDEPALVTNATAAPVKEILKTKGSYQLSKDSKKISFESGIDDDLHTSTSNDKLADFQDSSAGGVSTASVEIVSSKVPLPAAESLPAMGEKEIVCSLSSSKHELQMSITNDISSEGSLGRSEPASSMTEEPSFVQPDLSKILLSRRNIMRLDFRVQKRAEKQTKSAEGTKESSDESDQSSPMTAPETNTFKEIPFSRESQAKVHQTNVGTIDPTTKAISEKTQVEESAVSLKTLDLFPKVSSSNTAFDQSLYSTPTASYRLVIKKSLHNIIGKSYFNQSLHFGRMRVQNSING